MVYQIAEYFIGHERFEFTLGDFLEFFTGYAFIGLFYQLLRLMGW
jgi:hypothetical protein